MMRAGRGCRCGGDVAHMLEIGARIPVGRRRCRMAEEVSDFPYPPAIFAHFMVSGGLTNRGIKHAPARSEVSGGNTPKRLSKGPLPGAGRGPWAPRGAASPDKAGVQPGNITVLITWMTPFDCMTLAMVISAVSPLSSVSHSWPSFSVTVSGSPSTVLSSALPPPSLIFSRRSLVVSGRRPRDR